MIAFTICSNNYLPYARVLSASLKKFHPDWFFVVGLVDKRGPDEWYSDAGFDALIPVEEVTIPNFSRMVSDYSLVELNTAVKPYYFSHLFSAYPNQDQVLYFDPDIQIFAPLTELNRELKIASILLVPHFSTPQAGQPGIITPERRILQRGLYNLGFLGLKRSQAAIELLRWWQDKLQEQCRVSPEKGLFVDQKWMDLVPVYFEEVAILKEQGCDVAYWNLYENPLYREETELFAGESPLRFYHFSAFDKRSPGYIEDLANKFEPAMAEIIRDIYTGYLKLLKDNGLATFESTPCAYQKEQSGYQLSIDKLKRKLKRWLLT